MSSNLISIKSIKGLFKKYKIYPSKKFGQNFLINQKTLEKIIKTANLKPEDVVLEIGPGIGVLTKKLAEKVKKVIAVEKDQKMVEILKETLRGYNNIKIIQEDILKLNSKVRVPAKRAQKLELQLKSQNYKIVANIPYYLTSSLIRKFLESDYPPKMMVLMVQKEVGQRICSQPPKMNLLAVSVQFYAKPKVISFVPKKFFWPQPKVDSSIIKITPHLNNYASAELLFRIVKAGFSQPRKQLANNLSNMLNLEKNKVKWWLLRNKILPDQRAETLKIQDWINLTLTFNKRRCFFKIFLI